MLGTVCVTVLNPPAPPWICDVSRPPVPPVARLFCTAELTNDVTNELAGVAKLVVAGTNGWTVERVEKAGKVVVGETGRVVGERVAWVWATAVVAAAELVPPAPLPLPPFPPPPAVLAAPVLVPTRRVVVVVKVVVVVVVLSSRLACRCGGEGGGEPTRCRGEDGGRGGERGTHPDELEAVRVVRVAEHGEREVRRGREKCEVD